MNLHIRRKSLKSGIIITLLSLICYIPVFAQQDSQINSEETISRNDYKMDRLYRLFIEDKYKEVNHLWKINLVGFNPLKPNISYEQRINKFMSNECGTEYYALISSRKLLASRISISDQVRFYYNLGRRSRKGKRTSGFTGNYISLIGMFSYTSEAINHYTSSTNPDGKPRMYRIYKSYSVGINYGLQRRIGNIGFVDMYCGIRYGSTILDYVQTEYATSDPPQNFPQTSTGFNFNLGVRIGFAWDSFKSLKYMLK